MRNALTNGFHNSPFVIPYLGTNSRINLPRSDHSKMKTFVARFTKQILEDISDTALLSFKY